MPDSSENSATKSHNGVPMPQLLCATCGVPVDPEDYNVKQCNKCGAWYCYRHVGQYKAQCIPCKTYSLKNRYGR